MGRSRDGSKEDDTMARNRQNVRSIGAMQESTVVELRETEETFRLLVGSVLDYAIFMLDPRGRVLSWNAGAKRLIGYREAEILGQSFSLFFLHADVERRQPQEALQRASTEGRFEQEGWRVRKNGSTFWANVVMTAVRDKGGKLLGFAKITRDLTERQLATEQLRVSEARLQAFMNHSPSVMFIKDLEGRYLHVNESFVRSFGMDRKDILLRTDSEIFSPKLAAQFRVNDAKALTAQTGIEFEETATYGDGQLHTSIVHKFPIFDSNGRVAALGGIATDITERKQLEDALKQKNIELATAIHTQTALREHQQYLELVATHDALTGVPNRALLHQRAEHAIALSRRSGRMLAMLFIDLDRFKEVNDRLGHAAGDEVLREVATRLAGCLREVDTIARHGGDEFVVLLEELEAPEEVEQITTRMQEALLAPLTIHGRNIQMTISVGVAFYPRDGDSVSTLIRRADLAMYRAKDLGRNSVQVYEPDMDAGASS